MDAIKYFAIIFMSVLLLPASSVYETVPKLEIYTRCGYEVPGMILLRDLHAAMRLGRRKGLFMHVSTCITYDLKLLTTVVWKLWR